MTTKFYVDEAGRFLGSRSARPPYEKRTPRPPLVDPDTGEETTQDDLVEVVTTEIIPPVGGIEVPSLPPHGSCTWDFDAQEWRHPAPTADDVRAEAERRILEIMPAHQQRNSLALGMEMSMAHGPDPANWPAEQQAIHAQVMAAWAAIKALRAASNIIEAMDPIPADFRDNSYWS